ncbi:MULTISPECIES: flagellar filament capping protein FliD [unclassified Blastococcus]
MQTADLIDSLMSIEANSQTLLKNKLVDTKADANAYRAVNTKFDALRTAAEALSRAATWGAAKATSSSTAVAVTASSTAIPGSTTFTVDSLAARHTVVGTAAWTPPAADLTLTLSDRDGDTAAKTVTIAAGSSLTDAISAINAAGAGITAGAVGSTGGSRLQLSATAAGADGAFDVTGLTVGVVSEGTDAKVTVKGSGAYSFSATSTGNTFADLLPGVSVTVSKASTDPVTVDVVSDPDAVATAVQTLVNAANDVLTSIRTSTDTSTGSTAVLKGDSTLRALAGKVLEAVSSAIGGTASAAQAGIQLTRTGTLTFDKAVFTKALAADPALTQRLVHGTAAGVTPAVPGVAQRLLAVVKEAGDSVTGSLVVRAKSQDDAATALQDRIDEWDRRLELRRAALTKQFTAMETALGTLQNQSSWLASQLGSLSSKS